MSKTNRPSGPAKQAERSAEAKNAIADAAMELIAGKGFVGLTFSAIAERAGVSKSLLLYHFGSKAGLVRFLLDRQLAAPLKFFDEIEKENLSPLEAVYEALDKSAAHFHNSAARRGHAILLVDGPLDPDPDVQQRMLEYNRTVVKFLASGFEDEMRLGGGEPVEDPELLAATFLGCTRGIYLQWLLGGRSFDVSRSVKLLKRMMKELAQGKSGKTAAKS